MIIYTNQKSKKKKKTKKEIEQYQMWLDSVNSQKTNFSSSKQKIKPKEYIGPRVPEHRSTKQYQSLVTSACETFAKPQKVYTGDKMIGIGTLHKSNAVPIFRKEDALDQANMRR